MQATPSLPRCAENGYATVTVFGMTINNVTLDEVLEAIARQIAAREPGFVVTPNVDHVCLFQRNAVFREAYRKAFLVLADGMIVIWASRLCGRPIKCKLSGSDLVYWVTEFAAQRGYSIYFLGAAEGVAAKAAEILQARYPGFRIAGSYSPPFGFDQDPEQAAEVIRRVREANPDICYVAMGAPRQELWNANQVEAMGVPVCMGLGASMDFVAGVVRRAPTWMQQWGLEWAWRLGQEPRRLAKRYLVDDLSFVTIVFREWLRGSAGT